MEFFNIQMDEDLAAVNKQVRPTVGPDIRNNAASTGVGDLLRKIDKKLGPCGGGN